MVNLRKCSLSCKLFWGYSVDIDLDDIECNDDIVKIITKSLSEKFLELGLIDLTKIIDEKISENKFHIHKEFGDVLLSPKNEIIYVCDHN